MSEPKYKPRAALLKPPRKKSLHPESKLQKSAVTWFRYSYPEYKNLFFSIPNEGKRTNGKHLKEMGLTSGIPDTFISIPRGEYCGCYVEFKFGKNDLSENQEDIIPELRAKGYKVIVVWKLEEFIKEVKQYMENDYTDNH